jgi:hypothetical protein
MVILTDFIRKSYLPSSSDDHQEYDKLGAIPIFEKVRTSCNKNIKIGILTGSIVVIPKEKLNDVREICLEKGIRKSYIQSRPLAHTTDFLILEIKGTHKKRIVEIFTRLFEQGHINVIIGTKSLLGEGWDSPSINSLVLASFVGSFVLTNQMRGRAIRTQGEKPSKVANIWHLACVNEFISEWGDDIDLLRRRFDAFLGISFTEDSIERGFKRTGVGQPPFSRKRVTAINCLMVNGAAQRSAVQERWIRSLEKGGKIASLLRTEPKNIHKGFVFRKTITALFLEGVYLGIFIFSTLIRSIRYDRTPGLLMKAIGVASGIAFIVALPKCVRAVWLFVRNGPVEAELINIGEALLRTLISMKEITTDISKIKLITERSVAGSTAQRTTKRLYTFPAFMKSFLQSIILVTSSGE